ncbi:uncharacterized protein [Typha latifolia]|uniref:uncharacterized protein n=1 Tax=Typha latifolia TaxID=4733 RepID=UPI003C30AEF0
MSKDPSTAMDSSKQLGVVGIFRQALYLPSRNKKLMLPVMLLALLPNSPLLMVNYVSIYPLFLDFIIKLHLLSQNDPGTPQYYDLLVKIKRDAGNFVNFGTIFATASHAISLFSMMGMIYTSAMVYSGKQLAMGELFMRVGGTWKGPLMTCIYVTLLSVGYTVMSVCLIAAPILNANGSIGLIGVGVLLAVATRLLYVYLAMVWMVGVVISIVEDGGCYGLQALEKAGELVKGRRMQGFLIAIVLLVGDGVLTGGYSFGLTEGHSKVVSKNATGLVMFNIYLLLKMFSQLVCTLFYFECKRTQGREVGMSGDLIYTRVGVDITLSVDEGLAQ